MDKEREDLAIYRLETARQCIISANALIEIADYKGAANRSYYAVFHCMRSVLALCSIDFSKHSAVGAYFRREYIKTGIFDVSMSDIISEAFDIRSDSDYLILRILKIGILLITMPLWVFENDFSNFQAVC